MSSSASWLPDVVQNFSVWGGSGYLLKKIHMDGVVPYWACFALISIGLRTALFPLVAYSAHTAARFSKVAPELQFIVTLFQNDLKRLKAENRSLYEQRLLFSQNLQTLRTIYKLHNINPFTIFLSPLLQIPVFWYVATDLRKIVNGADPALAQELTEAAFQWVPDLTEPDPWYGLPIIAGVMLYSNVEVAMGRKNLSGPTVAKSDFASWLKDAFQTLAVFMPCFVANSPSGLQIYLVSSFSFTLVQGAALRNDYARTFLGLPVMGAAPTEPKYAKEFMEFKMLEQKARELRGDGPILGRNILAVGFETSFAGTYRPSTIKGSGIAPAEQPKCLLDATPKMDISQTALANRGTIVDGVSAPRWQLEEQFAEKMAAEEAKKKEQAAATAALQYKSRPSDDELMEAANRGVVLAPRSNKPKIPERIIAAKNLSRRTNKQAAKTVRRKKR
jgi:membrane protein insertase Oxa1/YidC/SpoIIIJ